MTSVRNFSLGQREILRLSLSLSLSLSVFTKSYSIVSNTDTHSSKFSMLSTNNRVEPKNITMVGSECSLELVRCSRLATIRVVDQRFETRTLCIDFQTKVCVFRFNFDTNSESIFVLCSSFSLCLSKKYHTYGYVYVFVLSWGYGLLVSLRNRLKKV